MKIEKGIVKEVYLPDDETSIGFIVKLDNETIDIVEKQNYENANIYRGDHVIITTDYINKVATKSIELDEEYGN